MPDKGELSPPSEIDREVFDHLVALAALELTPEEGEYLLEELNHQLEAIRELESIEVDESIPITSHGVPYSDAIRPPIRDDILLDSKDADAILAGAPHSEDRYIVVPDIPHEELE